MNSVKSIKTSKFSQSKFKNNDLIMCLKSQGFYREEIYDESK